MARPGYEPKGRTFESCRAPQQNQHFAGVNSPAFLFILFARRADINWLGDEFTRRRIETRDRFIDL